MSKNKQKDNKSKDNKDYRNSQSRGNRGRGNSKPKSEPKVTEEVAEEGKGPKDINNPAFYYSDPKTLDQLQNYSFNEFGGIPVEFDFGGNGNMTSWDNEMIATYWINPSLPETASGNQYHMDGATTASLRNFLKLSGSNAKTTNYAPQDVTILVLAIASLLLMISFIRRVFGVAYFFNYRNRTYPEKLLKMMGVDAADLNTNLADYRTRFNKLLAIAQQICFPSDIMLFNKCATMFDAIYLDDADSNLAQTYLLAPYSLWIFDEVYNSNGAGLRTVYPTGTANAPVPMSQILNLFESMISALLTSTSLNYIYSDVMRCVQKGYITNVIKFETIPENYAAPIGYNEEVKDWMHNATILGVPLATSDQYTTGLLYPTLTPDNDVSCAAGINKVLYHPQFKVNNNSGYTRLIDFDHDVIKIEERVRATRYAQRYTTVKTSGNEFYTNELALNDSYIVLMQITADGQTITDYYSNNPAVPSAGSTVARRADNLSKFDWAPLMYYMELDSNKEITRADIFGDLDYYTQFDYKLAKKIYDYEIITLILIG